MGDQPDTHELAAGLEEELRILAAQAPADLRMRLLVAAHCAGMLKRDLAATSGRTAPLAVSPDPATLVRQILAGTHDAEMAPLRAKLLVGVKDRLAVSNPDYAEPSR